MNVARYQAVEFWSKLFINCEQIYQFNLVSVKILASSPLPAPVMRMVSLHVEPGSAEGQPVTCKRRPGLLDFGSKRLHTN